MAKNTVHIKQQGAIRIKSAETRVSATSSKAIPRTTKPTERDRLISSTLRANRLK